MQIISKIKKKLVYIDNVEPVEIPIEQITVTKKDDINNLKTSNDEMNKNNSNLDEKCELNKNKISDYDEEC